MASTRHPFSGREGYKEFLEMPSIHLMIPDEP